jgi:predicted phosphodiesterase
MLVDGDFNFTIIHSNDLHSNFDPYYPRIAHFIKNYELTANRTVLKLDSGDWSSGSLFHMIFMSYTLPTYSPELEFFNSLQYDAITLGNHEFDARPDGLYSALKKANLIAGLRVPILISNIHFSPRCHKFNEFYNQENHGVYFVKHLIKSVTNNVGETLKIGIIGLFGIHSSFISDNTRRTNKSHCVHFVGFNDTTQQEDWDQYLESTHSLVMDLKNNHRVEVIVAMTHAGSPEDVKFAKAFNSKYSNKISVLLGSHTHERYIFNIDGTVIIQPGHSGTRIGLLEFSYVSKISKLSLTNSNNFVDLFEYNQEDFATKVRIDRYKGLINRVFLKRLPFQYDTFITKFPHDMKNRKVLGTWIATNLQKQLTMEIQESNKKKHNGYLGNTTGKLDVYFNSIESVRTIRGLNRKNDTLYFKDIFQMCGVGRNLIEINEYNHPGDFVTSFYIKKEFIIKFVTASRLYSLIDGGAWFVFSESLQFKWRWGGIPFSTNQYFGMMYDVKIHGKSFEELPDLLLIAAPSTIVTFLPKAKKLTYGIIDFEAYDKNGVPIKDIFAEETYYQEYLLLSKYYTQANKV